MALFHCNFLSKALFNNTDVTVFIPSMVHHQIYVDEPYPYSRDRKYPVLYLLHGHSGDHTDWVTRTNIVGYAEDRQLAVVMPSVCNSFYCDMAHGMGYWTYVSQELPLFIQSMFPVSDKREDTYVAGLSMGGYGAVKLALGRPERFASAATLSGFLDVSLVKEEDHPSFIQSYRNAFGEADPAGTGNDLLHVLEERVRAGVKLPKLYQACGTADPLYQANLNFLRKARSLNADITYVEEAGAGHEWGYWDRQIVKALDWMPLKYPFNK